MSDLVTPNELIAPRLREIVAAFLESDSAFQREATMRIPVDVRQDFDIVLTSAADRIEALEADRDKWKERAEARHRFAEYKIQQIDDMEAKLAAVGELRRIEAQEIDGCVDNPHGKYVDADELEAICKSD